MVTQIDTALRQIASENVSIKDYKIIFNLLIVCINIYNIENTVTFHNIAKHPWLMSKCNDIDNSDDVFEYFNR